VEKVVEKYIRVKNTDLSKIKNPVGILPEGENDKWIWIIRC